MLDMMELLKVIVIGIVQGVTEWLPISSTGHMILVDEFLQLNMSEAFKELFLVVIQLGSIMAVVVLFWRKLLPFSFENGFHIEKDTMSMWVKIVVSSIPAAVVELVWGDQLNALFYNYWAVAIMLILFGIFFIIAEQRNRQRAAKINNLAEIGFGAAFVIGFFQMIAAVFPGTSRSGATIVGALLLGISRPVAAEYSFFMAVPVMFGASFLKLLRFGFSFSSAELTMLAVAMIVAFIVSLLVIRLLMDYIRKHDFTAFGWYRIILGSAVLIYFGFLAS